MRENRSHISLAAVAFRSFTKPSKFAILGCRFSTLQKQLLKTLKKKPKTIIKGIDLANTQYQKKKFFSLSRIKRLSWYIKRLTDGQGKP